MMSGRQRSGSMRFGWPGSRTRSATWTRVTRSSSAMSAPRRASSRTASGCTASSVASRWIGHSATRGGATSSAARGVRPATPNLSPSYRYPIASLCGGTGSEPVVRASRSTAAASWMDGRLSTHSPVRWMFAGVCERAPKPSMQLRPSHHADDIGARFAEPSGLTELTRTTGVPK